MAKYLFLVISCTYSFWSLASDSVTTKPTKPRIIALAPHIVEMLYAVGAGEQIIGTTEHADYPEAAQTIPRIGNYARIQIEQVLALAPDIVLAWRTGNPSDDLARLTSLGLNIVYSEPKQLIDVANEIRHFSRLTGHAEQGEQVAAHFEQKLAALTAQYQQKSPITVFYELWSNPLTTIAAQAWPQQQLALCGADNVFKTIKNDYPQINLEQVIVANPSVIIQPKSQGEMTKDAVNWRQWAELTAVKREQIIHPNADMLHRMTPRMLDEVALLCAQLDEFR